ncbi:MAG: NAD-dependent succinate-semialdehyde dehydrogenase [Rhodothermales bacterium]|nr:NAD-dependent succinate-semialdehyde dehydrogenase [Rhodothermales bacterium]
MIQSLNPATGQVMRSFTPHSDSEVDDILRATDAAFRAWRQTSFDTRGGLMRAAGDTLRSQTDRLARMMVMEMGKPISQARAEVDKCAWVCDYYAANAAGFLTRDAIATDASESFVSYQPLGVILAVMPWNFPFWQVFRFAAPTLMAGNGAVLKHASNVPRCALAIEEIFSDAGFPPHLFRTLMIGGDSVERVIQTREVRAVSLTGSTEAGRAVGRAAGAALKKVVLELGGSDPYVILEDADLPEAVRTCVTSRLINNGQSCIAAKRFIVPGRILPEFERMFVEVMEARRVGDPMKEQTDVGPLARVDLRAELQDQVSRSIDLGAKCLLGGTIPEGDGAYYPPTVLTNVQPGMPAFDEELFGPVAAIVPASDEEEAIELANRSAFGLGAAVFTRNLVRGTRIAEEELDAGACFVNAFVRSDPRLPFGGVKESGYGRELGPHGIREFVNIKTVYVS